MNIEYWDNLLRMVLTGCIIGAILLMAYKIIGRFANEEMAKQLLTYLLASGTTLIGYHFGENSQK